MVGVGQLFLASLIASVRACSYAPTSGFAITNAAMQDGRLRLELTDMGNEDSSQSGESTQALLDYDTGTLTRFDEQNLEFMPVLLPFEYQTDAPSSWFRLNNTVVVARWYSASLRREFVLYQAADAFNDLQLAICEVPGTACELSLPMPSIGMLEAGRAPEVWDDIGVVSLRLQCCMCATNVYVKYNATSLTVLYDHDENYSLGATVWDPANDAVFVAQAFATGVGADARPLEIRRYDYATLTTSTVSLSTEQLETLTSGSCGGACIAGIVIGSTALLLLCGLACFVARRRRQQAQGAAASVDSRQVEAKMANAA